MGLIDVMRALRDAINTDLTAADGPAHVLGSPWIVDFGTPLASDLAKIQAQKKGVIIALYPGRARRDVQYLNSWYKKTSPQVGLIATLSGATITFSGAPSAGLNVHVPLGRANSAPTADAYYQTIAGDTLSSIAAAVAAAIVATGFAATSSGGSVTITSGIAQTVNVGGTGSITQSVNWITRSIQATIYAPTPDWRNAFSDALTTGLTGSTAQDFLTLADGSGARCKLIGDDFDEKSQLSYTLYQAFVTYDVTYLLERTVSATQIGVAKSIEVVANNQPVTLYTGG